MTIPTLEAIAKTIRDAGVGRNADPNYVARVVVETHFAGMLTAAYRRGERSAEGAEDCEVAAASERDAAYTIHQILGVKT